MWYLSTTLESKKTLSNVNDRYIAHHQVIIYVHTAPRNTQRRDVIRSTWANPRWYPMVRHKVCTWKDVCVGRGSG